MWLNAAAVLPHKTGFLQSPLTLLASFQVIFPPIQEVLHAPPGFLSNQELFSPFYQIMTLLIIAEVFLDS